MSLKCAQESLATILNSLPSSRPIPPEALAKIVSEVVAKAPTKAPPAAWENCLRKEVFGFVSKGASGTQDISPDYYDALFDRLDITLIVSEQDLIDRQTPLAVLQDVFDIHTVDSCARIFDWLESRSERLTSGMVPSKGKALVLLKQLNALVRRVSKTGGSAKFNGRILNFLSGVFPLGERSGVNLRGEYGPVWEQVGPAIKHPNPLLSKEPVAPSSSDAMQGVESTDPSSSKSEQQTDSPVVNDAPPPSETPNTTATTSSSAEEERADFYRVFWSLQLPFSSPVVFQKPDTMSTFKSNVNRILPVLSDATRKDRQSSGNKASAAAVSAGTKRKRDTESQESDSLSGNPTAETAATKKDYFFAKFLTNSDLLELEIADLHFRRQILIQLLILFNHLLTYQPKEKEKWTVRRAFPALQMDFTLNDEDTKWIRDTWSKVSEELKAATGHTGYKTFHDTILDLLERERAWVRWKNEGCPSFEKPPLDPSEHEEVRKKRRKFVEPIPDLPHALGTEDLTEVWELGYKGREDLESPPLHTSFERYVRDLKGLEKRIEMRKKQLEMIASRKTVPLTPKPKDIPAPAPSSPAVSTTIINGTISKLPPGLPAKPGSIQPPHPIPARPGTPATPAAPAPAPAEEAPKEDLKSKVVDPQLESFQEQREILLWRALRMAMQEGHLQAHNKTNRAVSFVGLADIVRLLDIIKAPPPPPSVAPKASPNNFASPIIPGADSRLLATETDGAAPTVESQGMDLDTLKGGAKAEVEAENGVKAKTELMDVDSRPALPSKMQKQERL